MRPLAAALCFGRGHYLLDGVERMRERPIADLVEGLTCSEAKLHVAIPAATRFDCCNRIDWWYCMDFGQAPVFPLMAAPLQR